MKILIFLLFLAFVSSKYIPRHKGRFEGINNCIGGKIIKKVIGREFCQCPDRTVLVGNECKPCIGGLKMFKSCRCPEGSFLFENKCVSHKGCSPGYIKIYNNTCIKKCPDNQIRVGNICKSCSYREYKDEFQNECLTKDWYKCKPSNPFPHQYIKPSINKLKKSVIYLYPKETMNISVQLNYKNNKFTIIYPKFNEKNIWNIRAKPNGEVLIKDKKYPYLLLESYSNVIQERIEGFIVSEESAEKFLEEKLRILGLNEKEKSDFITNWLPVLLRNKLSLCSFQTKKFFDNFELNITPKPDSLIRVFLTIKQLNRPINIKEQKLESNERKGFTVIEWGGSEL